MIEQQIEQISREIPPQVQLIAVSKTKPNSAILSAYSVGQRHFGENKVQELCDKWESLPKDIHWHIIGHLQTNKVKYIAPFIHLIHAVDSIKLLIEIDKQAKKHDRIISCLLQFHIAKEETKFGLSYSEATEILASAAYSSLENITIVGVMGMASFVEDEEQIVTEFNELAGIFKKLKETYFKNKDSFKEISMGMSGDYPLAIEAGSTMIRVGSTIFGSR
jgi:pyridoxal phosphate enzyme (YggS family)